MVQTAQNVTMLGTDACRNQSMPIYHESVTPKPTRDRVDKALKLSRRVMSMLDCTPTSGARQPAAAIARSIIAHSLTYDTCV